jgi:ribosome-binding protein aMBF1 (putative translation factor)
MTGLQHPHRADCRDSSAQGVRPVGALHGASRINCREMNVRNPFGRRGAPTKRTMSVAQEVQIRRRLARQLRDARQALGLTQDALAERLHVSQGRIKAYEGARAMPRTHELPLLCRTLNLEPNSLLGFSKARRHARAQSKSR